MNKYQSIIWKKIELLYFKMKPLVTAQKLLTWLCILPPGQSTSGRKKKTFIAFTFTIVGFLILLFIPGVIFIQKFALIDFEKSLFAFCVCLVCSCTIYAASVTYFLRPKIFNIFEKLTKIYDACKIIINFDL